MQLASLDQEPQARRKYASITGQEKVGNWRWTLAFFSTVMRLLAPSEAGADKLGKGKMSLGFVQ